MKKLIASRMILLFMAVASLSICLSCGWLFYQPELPQSSQK